MIIVEDTRNQIGKHKNINEQLERLGHKVVRSKLYAGDYSRVDSQSVCIDTKQDLQEVASNLTQQHDRFRAECIRASEAGIRLVILVEDGEIQSLYDVPNWVNPRLVRWCRIKNAQAKGKMTSIKIAKQPPINGERLYKAMLTMTDRYGVEWAFCRKAETGEKIVRLLE